MKYVWGLGTNIGEIVKKMKGCTEISEEQEPLLSNNTIIIGRGDVFK